MSKIAATKDSYLWRVVVTNDRRDYKWDIIADNFNQCCIIAGLRMQENSIIGDITEIMQKFEVLCLTTVEE